MSFTPYARHFGYDGGAMKRKALPKKREAISNPRLATLRKRVAMVPAQPGVYRWLDEEGTVLYVGKAKNLRNRLRSYVTKDTAAGPWKQSFLRQIADFDVSVTNTEVEALIFETNLIKELRPKYNVLMKDDKNYIYAKVTVQDPFPRVEAARKLEEDGSQYFGPMATGGELWAMLTMLRSIFPFRTCGMEIVPLHPPTSLSPSIPLEVVCRHKDRPTPCLDFHIEKCSAPCIGRKMPEEYFRESIDGVIRFLKGDEESVRAPFEERMRRAAAEKKFELAAQFRDYLDALDRLQGRQLVTDTAGGDADIIAVAVLSGRADVVIMQRRNGRLIGDITFSLTGHAEDAGDVLAQFLPQYYAEHAEIPEEILVSADVPGKAVFEEWLSMKKGRRVKITLPVRGKKSHLLQLAEKNVREKARQREAKWEAEQRNTASALEELKNILGLPAPPERIEGYDISHLGGTETVGSMTVMIGGKARSDQYRSFTVRSLKPGEVDDCKALKEVLGRRLRHLAEAVQGEEWSWTERGVAVRRGKKADRKALDAFLKAHDSKGDTSGVNTREFVIARQKNQIMGCGRIRRHEKTLELATVCVDESVRGQRLGRFIIRSLLKGIKKGKVYLETKADLEEYYATLGFRSVRTAPKPILERAERAQKFFKDRTIICMMFEASKNRLDPSLTARPNLLIIDGGKGQLSAAVEVLDSLRLDIPVIGLAKREEDVFVRGKPDPVAFSPDAPAKFLLMRLRDEAHRFANRHREQRGKKAARGSVLDTVPGIGPEGRKKLLRRFGSLASIRAASDAELSEVLSALQVRELRRRLS